MGLRLLQGVLILDTKDSNILRKEGKLDVEGFGNKVHVELDENGLKFKATSNFKEVELVEINPNAIYLSSETIDKIRKGERVLTTQGYVSMNKEGKTILEPKNVERINLVVHS